MKRAKKTPESSDYLMLAGHAAEHEQASNFATAAKLWLEAAKLAATLANQYWAESRSEFCQVRQLRNAG